MVSVRNGDVRQTTKQLNLSALVFCLCGHIALVPDETDAKILLLLFCVCYHCYQSTMSMPWHHLIKLGLGVFEALYHRTLSKTLSAWIDSLQT